MALLRFLDVRDPAAQSQAEAAIHAADPKALIGPDWTAGVVDVAATIPMENLCATLRFASFRVEAVLQRPRSVELSDILNMALQIVGFATFGGVVGMIVGGMLGYMYQALTPSCSTVLEGGPCATVVINVASGGAIIVASGTAVVTLIVGVLRLAHLRRTGEDVPFLRF